jgi:hypothetical protein
MVKNGSMNIPATRQSNWHDRLRNKHTLYNATLPIFSAEDNTKTMFDKHSTQSKKRNDNANAQNKPTKSFVARGLCVIVM